MPGRAYRSNPKGRDCKCELCGCEWRVFTRAGPVPRRCDACDPAGASKRQHEQRTYEKRVHPDVEALTTQLVKVRKRANSRTTLANQYRAQRDAAREGVATLRAEAVLAVQRERQYRAALQEARREATAARARPVGISAVLERGMSERAIFDEVEQRARRLGPPGSDTVKVALVRLRHAAGAEGTAAAAEDLAAALIVWARVLRSRTEVPGTVQTAGAKYARQKRQEARAA